MRGTRDVQDDLGRTPLDLMGYPLPPELQERIRDLLPSASYLGQRRVISALVGTNGDARLPALLTAVLRNDSLAVKGLVNEADPKVTDGSGWSLLHYGASAAGRPVVSKPLDAGVDPNLKTGDSYSPLHLVTDPELVSLFVAAGAKNGRSCSPS